VVLLGDVHELKVESERADNEFLLARLESAHGFAKRFTRFASPRSPGQESDPFLGFEQCPTVLLDKNTPERVTEEADVTPQAGVGAHPRMLLDEGQGAAPTGAAPCAGG
jgi:hypothetical protein